MNDKPAMANTQAFAVITQDELSSLRAELAELRARAGELERQVRDKHEAATVDEICNAYESGVGHRGRPTASVNPYRKGSDLATAYNIGALGDRESPAAAAVPEDVAKDALGHIAAIAHSGGLAGISEYGALCAIRKLTLPWNGDGTLNELRGRVDAAILSADTEGRKDE